MRDQLIATARRLAKAGRYKPRQTDLRRAVSTAYYALFHCLAKETADRFIGGDPSCMAWNQAYRAIEHRMARNACEKAKGAGFSIELVRLSDTFIILQQRRHDADYDPAARFTKADALTLVADAEAAIEEFARLPASSRKAYCAWLVFKNRN